VERFAENPLIRPEDVPPSHEGLEVVGAFNAGAFTFEGRVGLLLRVAERPIRTDPTVVPVPVFDLASPEPRVELITLRADDPAWNFSDPRVVAPAEEGGGPHHYLTNLSHLRLAWSDDGRRFELGDAVWPHGADERFGIEDARVTEIGGLYHIAHTVVSKHAVCVALMTTADFRRFDRRGLILPPENKDVGLFPERIGGRYVALHRPSSPWCRPGVWLAHSPDLVHWGEPRLLAGPRPGGWDEVRIGAGPPPIRVPDGWLEIYHGCGDRGYCLGAMLLDADDPSRLLARSAEPFMVPEADYERGGFFNDVVFCNGLVERPDGELWLYYGGADRVTAGCRCAVQEILDTLEPCK
jgi:predicted GH43/DUF377 family glycosyl hydrolase